jgi:hypothetical protein
MIRNVLTHIESIAPCAVAALGLFLLVFVFALVRVIRMKPEHAAAMGRLPLEDSDSLEGAPRHE